MKRYNPKTPRTSVAFASVALTAATMAFAILVPARLDSGRAQPVVAAVATAAPRLTDDSLVPTTVERIDVVAIRDSKLAGVPGRMAPTKRKNEG